LVFDCVLLCLTYPFVEMHDAWKSARAQRMLLEQKGRNTESQLGRHPDRKRSQPEAQSAGQRRIASQRRAAG
jgi:hypothetical protein